MGIRDKGRLIAGVSACFTSFKIVYVSIVFVEKEYRRKGIGKLMMNELEKRAIQLGANMIRLDTFDFQGREFYKNIGYNEVGYYMNELDCFSESFFLKKLF
ncbi:MAG TPA: GNAT family N-acetyltransferase [Mobilitalea sp.]|nr:GNAT family N-acetyltransferase [Mobilitalea sp.]